MGWVTGPLSSHLLERGHADEHHACRARGSAAKRLFFFKMPEKCGCGEDGMLPIVRLVQQVFTALPPNTIVGS